MEEVKDSGRLLLVTGGSGFLGSEVVRLARHEGWRVRTLVHRAGSPVIGDPAFRAEVFHGDLEDQELLARACNGATALVHAAGLAHVFGKTANDLANFRRVNATGTESVVRAAVRAGVSRIAIASSVSVYGTAANGAPRGEAAPCDEGTPCLPQTPYAVSKYEGELLAAQAAAGSATHLAILRFATLYGEGDRGNVARLITALAKGRFVWPGPGLNRKSLIHRTDAARACLTALCPIESGGASIFNVSSGDVTMEEIVTAICAALNRPVPRLRVPAALLTAAARLSRGIGDPARFSHTLLKFLHDDVYPGIAFERATGFAPTVLLQEGIRRQVAVAAAQGER